MANSYTSTYTYTELANKAKTKKLTSSQNVANTLSSLSTSGHASLGSAPIADSAILSGSATYLNFAYMPTTVGSSSGGSVLLTSTTGAAAGRIYLAGTGLATYPIDAPLVVRGLPTATRPQLCFAGSVSQHSSGTGFTGTDWVYGNFDSWLMEYKAGYSACGTATSRENWLNNATNSTTYLNFLTSNITYSAAANSSADTTWFWNSTSATGTYKQVFMRGTTYVMKKTTNRIGIIGQSRLVGSLWMNDRWIMQTSNTKKTQWDTWPSGLIKINMFATSQNTAYNAFRVQIENHTNQDEELRDHCDFIKFENSVNSDGIYSSDFGEEVTLANGKIYQVLPPGDHEFYWIAAPSLSTANDFAATTAYYYYNKSINVIGVEPGRVYTGEFIIDEDIIKAGIPFDVISRLKKSEAILTGTSGGGLTGACEMKVYVPADGPPIHPSHLHFMFHRLE